MAKGKKYVDSAKLIDRAAQYDVTEAMDLVIKTATAKFDETVELHVKLGVDSRHADQQVRGAIVLPHGTGKTARVLVFAKGDKADEARAAGADFVGDMDMVQKIQSENWFDFDVVVATPDMMGVVGRLGKVLGPKGLMPSPKAGTVTPNVTQAINEIKAGKVEYRLDKTNIIHRPGQARRRQGPVYQELRRRLHHGPRREGQRRQVCVRSAGQTHRGDKMEANGQVSARSWTAYRPGCAPNPSVTTSAQSRFRRQGLIF